MTYLLLEDYVEGGVRIPANTHLAAVCKIGDRLELQVRSLDLGGRIVPLALVKGQVLRVYLYEKGGARNLVMEVGRKDVERVRRVLFFKI